MGEAAVLREVPLEALPDVRPIREIESRRHDADDLIVRPVQSDRLAYDRTVAVESVTPQSVADHRLEVAIDIEPGIAGERGSDLWCDAEDPEEIPARLDARDAYRIVDTVRHHDLRHP